MLEWLHQNVNESFVMIFGHIKNRLRFERIDCVICGATESIPKLLWQLINVYAYALVCLGVRCFSQRWLDHLFRIIFFFSFVRFLSVRICDVITECYANNYHLLNTNICAARTFFCDCCHWSREKLKHSNFTTTG